MPPPQTAFPRKEPCPSQPQLQIEHVEGPDIPQDRSSRCCVSCPAFCREPSVPLVLGSPTSLARVRWVQGDGLARLRRAAPRGSPACGSGCHPPRGRSRSRSRAPCPRSPDGCSARWCPAGKSPPGRLYLPGKQPGRKATSAAVSPGHLGCSRNPAPDPQHHGAGVYPHPLEIRRGDGVTDPSPNTRGPPPTPQRLLGGL